MKGEKGTFKLGEYLRSLREKKGVSLRDVQKATGISNAYLSQLETGERRKLPSPERLRSLAEYYNVSTQELLQKAGYLLEGDIEEPYEAKINRLYQYVINKPEYKYGHRIKGKISLDVKKFIIEMYEKMSGEPLLK